jgi:hypothetical protein
MVLVMVQNRFSAYPTYPPITTDRIQNKFNGINPTNGVQNRFTANYPETTERIQNRFNGTYSARGSANRV